MSASRLFFPTTFNRRTLQAALPSSFLPTPGLALAVRPLAWAQLVRPDAVSQDAVGPDAVGPDVAGADVAGPDAAGADVAGADVTGRDAAGSDVARVAKLYQVTPQLYRSAQPDADGFRAVEALGIRAVVSLRQTVNDVPLAAGTDLILYRVAMKSRYVGENNGAKVVQAMRGVREGMARGPVLVHCRHGADRTGLIAALWRILYEGWTRQQAIDELIEGGYGFHPIWSNIPRYLRKVDLKDLRDRIES